jgi:hypothetical protein
MVLIGIEAAIYGSKVPMPVIAEEFLKATGALERQADALEDLLTEDDLDRQAAYGIEVQVTSRGRRVARGNVEERNVVPGICARTYAPCRFKLTDSSSSQTGGMPSTPLAPVPDHPLMPVRWDSQSKLGLGPAHSVETSPGW